MARAKIVAFSCLHAPITSGRYFRWLIGQIEDFRPDIIVNLGDWYEGKFAKRFTKRLDETWSAVEEHRAVAEQAEALRDAAPGASKYWLWGNHDDNAFGNQPDRIQDDLRESVHYRENVRVAPLLASWRITERYDHRVFLRLGPVTFQHGCDSRKTMGSTERDNAYRYGTPFGLYVCGHTHRPLPVTQASERSVPVPYWLANPGCGIDFSRAHYMERLPMDNWGHGVVLIEAAGVNQRRSAYASRQWDAEVRVMA